MGYVKNILVGVDQTGNAVAGGNPDVTISGRIGYYSHHAHSSVRWFWIILEFIVDATFYPLDGKGHCHTAYHLDEDENYNPKQNPIMLFILSLITVGSCLILFWINYTLWLIGLIKQDKSCVTKKKLVKNN